MTLIELLEKLPEGMVCAVESIETSFLLRFRVRVNEWWNVQKEIVISRKLLQQAHNPDAQLKRFVWEAIDATQRKAMEEKQCLNQKRKSSGGGND